MKTRSATGAMARYDRRGILFVLPYFLGLLLFFAFPTLYTVFLSFTNLKGISSEYAFVGLRNYLRLASDRFFWTAFLNTWKLWIPNIVLQFSFGITLAMLFSDVRLKKLKGGGVFRALFYMPNLITAASVAILFEAFFSYPNGPVNQVLGQWGIAKQSFSFFTDKTATSLLVSFVQFWMWYGQTTIIFFAGMIAIPVSYYEAAQIDGAGTMRRFFKITLPQLKPVIVYVLITALTGGLQLFDVPFLLTDGIGSPDGSIMTMTMYLYKHAFTGVNNYAYASAVAIGQFIIIMLCSGLIRWPLRDRDAARGGARS